jgi:putative transposase
MNKNLPKFNDNSYAHFITTNTYHHYPYFRDEELCQIIAEELEFYSRKYGFALIGYVIMPDHLHLLVWWDKEEKPNLNISRVMNSIKTMTTKRIKRRLFYSGGVKYMGRLADVGQPTRRPFRLWQPGFYDFDIYSEAKLLEKLDYMHNNPIAAGVVSSPECYKWSSWRLHSPEGVV